MRIEPEFTGASVVLVGNLNPAIFTPDWFLRHGLITSEEYETHTLDVVHSQITQFRTEWFELAVEPNKFNISTTQDPRIRICDITVRTFGELLPHTPLARLGINRQIHFRVGNETARDRLGWNLAPPDAWGEWAPMLKSGTGPKHGGLASITMQQRDVDDRPAGHVSATVQPSNLIPRPLGVYVQVNDHYELADPSSAKGASEIVELLKKNFDKSQQRSDWIVDQVMKLANA